MGPWGRDRNEREYLLKAPKRASSHGLGPVRQKPIVSHVCIPSGRRRTGPAGSPKQSLRDGTFERSFSVPPDNAFGPRLGHSGAIDPERAGWRTARLRRRGVACPGRLLVLGLLLVGAAAAQAQLPAPPGMSLAEAAAKRFPQPVRVGDLLGRQVLRPIESQPTLGWVQSVVRRADGTIDVVVDYGGWFRFLNRPIAVPADAMALLGQYLEIVDFTPKQLDQFKTFDGAGTSPLPPDSIIRVGLARPSH